jgi:hypothetical protein
MPGPSQLPRGMTASSFLKGDALAAGMSPKQLRGARFSTPSRGIRIPRREDLTLAARVRAASWITEKAAISHSTAARLWGFPLPAWMEEGESVHVTRPAGAGAIRRKGITGHRAELRSAEVVVERGVRVTSRVKTWLDLAAELPVDELVVIGDYLVRAPRPRLESRWKAYADIGDLRMIIQEHKGKRGIARASEAVELIRVGADSAPETRLRLALLRAGLPEPELNLPLIDDYGVAWHEPDMQYRLYKIAIEYEGAHHRSAEQLERDIVRGENTAAAGWLERRISRADMRDGAIGAVTKIRKVLLERGWRPS